MIGRTRLGDWLQVLDPITDQALWVSAALVMVEATAWAYQSRARPSSSV
ncbi:MAG: hypothetical protein HC828_16145 [Blastochloris sp.]|nr:hypothetical protein [Blastochloris sp.]